MKQFRLFIYSILLVIFSKVGYSQTILNAYARVSAINSGAITLTVTNVNEASHTFTVGGDVIVMQMQDDCIGTNTTNISTFGNLSAIANAGRYEIRKIASRLPAVGTPTSITLDFALTFPFNTSSNSSVQLISFRNLGLNFATTSNISGLPWNGNIGGIVAIQVTNTLTLNHSISADGIGFRGGAVSTNYYDGTTNCNTSPWHSSSTINGYKGEGIYKITNVNFTNSRAKILNGGGGGGQINAGGGGGGNYSAGGIGGRGWSCALADNSEGIGGIALSGFISASRVFMGGGGGGGQQNDGQGSKGGNGGGIVFVKTKTIRTSTTCVSPIKISANGINSPPSVNDGTGGAGAGGSIILDVSSFSITTTCSLAINANAGNGGASLAGGQHAGGAGGAQGVIIFSAAQPTLNVITTTNNGIGGSDCTSCPTSATSGSGTNDAGIISGLVTPLPIEVVSFFGECDDFKFYNIKWITANEVNNDYFEIEKSLDGLNWKLLAQINGAGNSTNIQQYSFTDENENLISYYRLKQIDFDKKQTIYPNIIYAEVCNKQKKGDLLIFPNPANSEIYLSNFENFKRYRITNNLGQLIQSGEIFSNVIYLSNISAGLYYISFYPDNGNVLSKKIQITKN